MPTASGCQPLNHPPPSYTIGIALLISTNRAFMVCTTPAPARIHFICSNSNQVAKRATRLHITNHTILRPKRPSLSYTKPIHLNQWRISLVAIHNPPTPTNTISPLGLQRRSSSLWGRRCSQRRRSLRPFRKQTIELCATTSLLTRRPIFGARSSMSSTRPGSGTTTGSPPTKSYFSLRRGTASCINAALRRRKVAV